MWLNKEFIYNYRTSTLLCFLFLTSLLLRLYNLNFQSYWLDELVSARISDPCNDLTFVFTETLKGGAPLYQVLLWGWYNIIGFTEMAGRLFSALVGSLAVIALFYLGKEIFNKNVGAIAGVILAFNEFAIFYSQETRAYSLLLFLTILSSLMLFRLFKDSSVKNFILYFFSIASVFYTHYFGFFVLIAHSLFLILYKPIFIKENLKSLLILLLFLILAVLPLVYNLFELSKIKEFWIQPPKWNFWWYYFIFYFKSRLLVIVFGFLILIALIKYFKFNTNFKEGMGFLIILIITSYGIPYFRSIYSTSMLTERYTIIVLPAIFLLISLGVYEIRKLLRPIYIILFIITLSSFNLYNRNYYTLSKKEEWKQVLLKVKEENISNLPIYDIVYEGWYFKTYAKLLSLEVSIQDHYEFIEQNEEFKLPSQFWILSAHRDYIKELDLVNGGWEIDRSFKFHRAEAVRVSRGEVE